MSHSDLSDMNSFVFLKLRVRTLSGNQILFLPLLQLMQNLC